MTEDAYLPRPMPFWFGLGASTPTLLVALHEISRELGGPWLGVERRIAFALWIATTLPLVFLLVGVRALLRERDADGRTREVQASADLLARADKMVARHLEAIGQVQVLLAQAAPGEAVGAPRPVASRSRRAMVLVGVVALFLLAGGGIAYAFTFAPSTSAVHIHAAFAVFVDGERLSYAHPVFDLSQRGIVHAHLHTRNPDVLHIEGPAGMTLGTILHNAIGTTLVPDGLTLDDLTHGGRVLAANATASLHVQVAARNSADWRSVADAASYVPGDRDRVLISFGNGDPPRLASEAAAVALVPADP